MNSSNPSIHRALVAAAFAFLFSFLPAVADSTQSDLGQAAGSMSVPEGVTASEVQDAIIMALSGRQWGIKVKEDGRVVGYLRHRSNEATVTFLYNTTKIDLFCVGWAISKKTGVRQKPEQPRGWLKNLQTDITKVLNRTATTK